MPKVKEEWAREIMGQAIVEIRSEEDVPKVMKKVKATALGQRADLMKIFEELIELKRKANFLRR